MAGLCSCHSVRRPQASRHSPHAGRWCHRTAEDGPGLIPPEPRRLHCIAPQRRRPAQRHTTRQADEVVHANEHCVPRGGRARESHTTVAATSRCALRSWVLTSCGAKSRRPLLALR